MVKKILAALAAGLLLWALVSHEAPVERTPASETVPNVSTSTTAGGHHPQERRLKTPAPHPRHRFESSVIERHLNQEPERPANEEQPSPIPGFNLLPSVQAVPLRQYQASMGPELARQSGYVLFRSERARSSIEAFDGVHLPVVKYPGRAVLGVVTGDIEVVFKTLPPDLAMVARRMGLVLAAEMRNIKTAFFAAKSYPADLTRIAEELSRLPGVEKAEISVVFGSRRGT